MGMSAFEMGGAEGTAGRVRHEWLPAHLRGRGCLGCRQVWSCFAKAIEGSSVGLVFACDDGRKDQLVVGSSSFVLMLLLLFPPFAVKEGEELISSCLSPGFKTEWEHAEIVYRVKGQKAGIVTWPPLHFVTDVLVRVQVNCPYLWHLSLL